MDSTIVELLLHKCNFVFKQLDREGPGAKVRSNLRSKSPLKISIFQKNHFIPNPICTLVTHLSKSVEKNLAH